MKRKLEQGWDHDETPSRQLLTYVERDRGDTQARRWVSVKPGSFTRAITFPQRFP